MSDRSRGEVGQTIFGGGTKIPIVVVVSRSQKLAIALQDAAEGEVYWSSNMTYIAHQINFFMWPYSPFVAVFNDMNGYKIYLGNRMEPVTPTPLKRTANNIFRYLLLPFRIKRNETSMFKTSNFRLQNKRGRVVGQTTLPGLHMIGAFSAPSFTRPLLLCPLLLLRSGEAFKNGCGYIDNHVEDDFPQIELVHIYLLSVLCVGLSTGLAFLFLHDGILVHLLQRRTAEHSLHTLV